MTGIWISGAFLAGAALGWRLALVVVIVSGVIWLIQRRAQDVPVVLLVMAMAVLGAVRSAPPVSVIVPAWVDRADGLRGQIMSRTAISSRSQSFVLSVSEARIDGDWQPATGTACVYAAPFPRSGIGDRVTLTGKPEALADQPPNIRAYLSHRNCGASVFAQFLGIDEVGGGWDRGLADLRSEISNVLQRAAPGDSGALLSGLVTGDDRFLTGERREAFLRTGTTHITAVSGSNVALVVSILITVGVAGGWRHNLGWQLTTVLAIWFYALLVGGEPPVVRAALVATAAVLASRVGRRPDFVTLIAVAAAVMVFVEPKQIWSLSFQLSFAASLGLVLVMSGLANEGRLAGVGMALRATIAAQIATLPVLWLVIGDVSLTSVPANLLIAPLIGVAFPLAAFAATLGLIWYPLGAILALPARLCSEGVFVVIDFLGGSRRAMANVGESSLPVALVVTLVALLSVLAMSPDAWRWGHRVMRRTVPERGGPSAASTTDGPMVSVEPGVRTPIPD